MRELSQLLAEVIQAHRRRAPNASRARLLPQQTFLYAARALREQPITLPAAQLRVQLVRQAQLLRQRALLSAPTATRALLLSQQAFLYALIVPLPVIKR